VYNISDIEPSVYHNITQIIKPNVNLELFKINQFEYLKGDGGEETTCESNIGTMEILYTLKSHEKQTN